MIAEHAREVEADTRRKGQKDANGYNGTPEQSLANRTAGLEAEFAFSVYACLPWAKTIGDLNAPDVLPDIEVKNRKARYRRYLIETPAKLRRERRYVITYGRNPELSLAGWLYGHEAGEYPVNDLANGRDAGHVVPADDLRPIQDLEEIGAGVHECRRCGDDVIVYGRAPAPFTCGLCLEPA